MNGLIALLTLQLRSAVSRNLTVAAIFAVAIVVALFSLAYFLMAAQVWLAQFYQSTIEAELTIAGALAVIAIVIALVGRAKHNEKPPVSSVPIAVALAGPAAVRIVPKLLNAKVLGVAAVILGGIVVGRELRKG